MSQIPRIPINYYCTVLSVCVIILAEVVMGSSFSPLPFNGRSLMSADWTVTSSKRVAGRIRQAAAPMTAGSWTALGRSTSGGGGGGSMSQRGGEGWSRRGRVGSPGSPGSGVGGGGGGGGKRGTRKACEGLYQIRPFETPDNKDKK